MTRGRWGRLAGGAVDGLSLAVCASVLALLATVVRGVVGPTVLTAAQGVLPWLGVMVFVTLTVAVVRRRRAVSLVALLTSVAVIAVLLPTAYHRGPPDWAEDAPTFTLYAANVRYSNSRRADVAAAVIEADADVVVLNEVTPDQRAALAAAGIDRLYPHQIHSDDHDLLGEMILSRIDTGDVREEWNDPIGLPALTVTVGGLPVRIYATHTQAPHQAGGRRTWLAQFEALGALVDEAETDVVLAGDFNASPFHPPFRRLLDRSLTDAHRATGHGLSTSWAPGSAPLVVAGRVMRLDHALSTDGVAPLEVVDAAVPGSDHRSMKVTYAVRA